MTKRRYTDKQILNAVSQSRGLVFLAAKHLGCTPSTIHHRAQKNPKIRECIEDERGWILDFAESKLLQAVKGGEAWAVCFLLKTQGKGRGYVERQEIKAEARVEIVTSDEAITDDELAAIIRRGIGKVVTPL